MKRLKLGVTAMFLVAGFLTVAAANAHKLVITTYDIVGGPSDVAPGDVSLYCGAQSDTDCAIQKHDGVATGVVIKAVRLNP